MKKILITPRIVEQGNLNSIFVRESYLNMLSSYDVNVFRVFDS